MDLSNLQNISDLVTFHPLTLGTFVAAVLAVVLLYVSGFASGSEIAFFSLSPSDLAEIEEENHPADKHVKELREDSERTLATILITNNFVNVTIIMLCNYVFASLVQFKALWIEFLCITVLLTFLLLLFGEIMPKIYSRQNPLKFCRRCVSFVMAMRRLFWPLESLLIQSGALAEKVVQKENLVLSVDDLEQALELTDKEDIKEEQQILKGIIRFGDETAKEVMTSRQDIVDLDIRSSYTEVLQCVVENNYSRIPVYQDNTDNIRGVLYIKDLLPHLSKPANFRWQSLIRPPYFVPETKKIDDLLREFQENKVHIAIVVDEFGGTSGLVTLEDILEEIVGEINDEFDEANIEDHFKKLDDGSYLFKAQTSIVDFCKVFGVDEGYFEPMQGEADTLAGLILEIEGRIPEIGFKFNFEKFHMEITDADSKRIKEVKVVFDEE